MNQEQEHHLILKDCESGSNSQDES